MNIFVSQNSYQRPGVKQTEAALPISEQARIVWQKYSESPRAYLRMDEVKILEQVFNPEAFEEGEG